MKRWGILTVFPYALALIVLSMPVAPMGTFRIITTGLSVMLPCFGPGVFSLFTERCRKFQPKSAVPEKKT